MSGGPRAIDAIRRTGAIVLGVVALCLVAATAQAADGVPEGGAESQYGYALAHELMSPFCPGRTLAACPSDKAAELRQWILIQEAAGATREEVVSALEARYGEVIRSSPEAEGWGLAAWLLPGAALLAGAVGVFAVLRRMTARDRGTPGGATVSDGSDARVTPLRSPGGGPIDAGGGAARTGPDDAELERLVDAELAASER